VRGRKNIGVAVAAAAVLTLVVLVTALFVVVASMVEDDVDVRAYYWISRLKSLWKSEVIVMHGSYNIMVAAISIEWGQETGGTEKKWWRGSDSGGLLLPPLFLNPKDFRIFGLVILVPKGFRIFGSV
jgi:hypothetical protein